MDFSSHRPGFGRKEVVEYLLQYGADVHAKDDGGFFVFVLFLSWSSPRGTLRILGKQYSLFLLELNDKSPTEKN